MVDNVAGRTVQQRLNAFVAKAMVMAIRCYQLTLSVLIGRQCRFYPSCSHYAAEAIREHGPWRGAWMALRRIGRCHPWHEGGFDPVPGANQDHT